jgi:hypothetical protein
MLVFPMITNPNDMLFSLQIEEGKRTGQSIQNHSNVRLDWCGWSSMGK